MEIIREIFKVLRVEYSDSFINDIQINFIAFDQFICHDIIAQKVTRYVKQSNVTKQLREVILSLSFCVMNPGKNGVKHIFLGAQHWKFLERHSQKILTILSE